MLRPYNDFKRVPK